MRTCVLWGRASIVGKLSAANPNEPQRAHRAHHKFSKHLRSAPFASKWPPLGSSAARRGGSTPLSRTKEDRAGIGAVVPEQLLSGERNPIAWDCSTTAMMQWAIVAIALFGLR